MPYYVGPADPDKLFENNVMGCWELSLRASLHGVPSPKSSVWLGCLHGNTFWRWGLGLVSRVWWSKKLDPTHNPRPPNIFASNNQHPTLMIFKHNLMVSWGSKVGTLPLCWDLLTRVDSELGTPCEPVLMARSHGVPSPMSQVWHGCLHTWQYFLELRLGTCVESLGSKTSLEDIFSLNNENATSINFWGSNVGSLASMLELVNMCGTWSWGSMWTRHEYKFPWTIDHKWKDNIVRVTSTP